MLDEYRAGDGVDEEVGGVAVGVAHKERVLVGLVCLLALALGEVGSVLVVKGW